jgi:hypothetical protein
MIIPLNGIDKGVGAKGRYVVVGSYLTSKILHLRLYNKVVTKSATVPLQKKKYTQQSDRVL